MASTKKLTEFFKQEVRDFSIYSCERALPSGVDGLKPSQRKVVFGMLKNFPNQEVKVSIASASIMSESCYHHGSLDGVVVNMSQSFTGSNNLPLLEGIGQFGSRISPDAAATRYIFTKLSPVFNKIVSEHDAPILEHNVDDDTVVEPKFYLPIIPMVLVNGADGMGTGYATYIMGYDPNELKSRCIRRLNGQSEAIPLKPWYNGFKGTIERVGDQVVVKGVISVLNSTTLVISELPVGQYTTRYRSVLNKLESDGIIKTYDDVSSEEKTEFIVKTSREFIQNSTPDTLLNTFKLIAKSTENFTVWTDEHKIKKFDSADDLLNWFVDYRLSRYSDRKASMLEIMNAKLLDMTERIQFIRLYLKRSSDWSKMESTDIESELSNLGFKKIQDLMNIRVSRLTGTAINELESQIEKTRSEVESLESKSAKDLYKADLQALKI